MMMLFGFEADTIEIALHEQLDLVDKIFVVEATVTHKGVRHYKSLTAIHLSIPDAQTTDVGEAEVPKEIQCPQRE